MARLVSLFIYLKGASGRKVLREQKWNCGWSHRPGKKICPHEMMQKMRSAVPEMTEKAVGGSWKNENRNSRSHSHFRPRSHLLILILIPILTRILILICTLISHSHSRPHSRLPSRSRSHFDFH